MRVFVTGGGTGGHLFPAISLGEELAARGYDVHLVTDTRCKGYLKDCALRTHILRLGFMRAGILPKITLAARMLMAISWSIVLLICYRPQVIVGFGGYTAFPMLFAARLLFIPIMLHEQNCFLGKVNDMFARSAVKLALNFAETTNVPTKISKKLVIAGNPVRKEFRGVSLGLDPRVSGGMRSSGQARGRDVLKLLIIGGSQGAKVFSSLVPAALQIIHTKNPNLKISIIQQTKIEDHDILRKIYKDLDMQADIQTFFHNMKELYINADLIICRSGASTIAELIHLAKPAIFIPFPGAAEDHQTFNAKVLESKGAGWMLHQTDTTPEMLADTIFDLANDHKKLIRASKKLMELQMPSEQILADAVEEIITN
jgi:UDP-N-acetylglucosamine--N-acetylmuramyl-(pentapeptide) pyrophosphoryl-undecaprenol N-acetylglucosamine transferase